MRLFTVLRCKLADGYKSGVFCSRGCSFLERGLHGSPRFQDSQDGRRTVWERYGNRFAPKPEFTTTCAQCAVQFRSTLARRKFCSSDCANARQRALNPRAVQSTRECCVCGARFLTTHSKKRTCSVGCSRKHARTKRGSGRATARAKRHGGERHYFNVIKILERDGWRCKLCGVRTPRSKRGTYADDAPEIDHIIPIAEGGDHAEYNVQCLCRRCNAEKGARALGQLGLNFRAEVRDGAA